MTLTVILIRSFKFTRDPQHLSSSLSLDLSSNDSRLPSRHNDVIIGFKWESPVSAIARRDASLSCFVSLSFVFPLVQQRRGGHPRLIATPLPLSRASRPIHVLLGSTLDQSYSNWTRSSRGSASSCKFLQVRVGSFQRNPKCEALLNYLSEWRICFPRMIKSNVFNEVQNNTFCSIGSQERDKNNHWLSYVL